MLQNELTEQSRLASGLIEDLRASFLEGQDGRGTLDFLSLVNDPMQTAVHYRRMLATATREYVEFSRPPFAVDPLDEQLVKDAATRGVNCRLLIESGAIDEEHRHRLREYRSVGIEIRFADRLPMKLALFDSKCGLVALLDPVLTRPSWTAVIFEHDGFAEAMAGLFETYWCRALEEHSQKASAKPHAQLPVATLKEFTVEDCYADLKGVRLHYLKAGAGPLIIFLHGVPEAAGTVTK